MLKCCSHEKKIGKIFKNFTFKALFRQKKIFFLEITKADHKLSRMFYFIKIS